MQLGRIGFPKEQTHKSTTLKSEEEGAAECVVVVPIVIRGVALRETQTDSISCLHLQDEGVGDILKVKGSLPFHIIHDRHVVLQKDNPGIIGLISSQSELEAVGPT